MKLAQLHEAKYAGQIDLKQANQMYQDAYDNGAGELSDPNNRNHIRMKRPLYYSQGEQQRIVADVVIPKANSVDEATKATQWFAKKYNIPYNDISQVSPVGFGQWSALLSYYPFGAPQ